MLLKDLTKEQKEKICNHFLDEISEDDEDYIRKMYEACSKCPFGLVRVDGLWIHCCAWVLFQKLPQELEEVIKDEV